MSSWFRTQSSSGGDPSRAPKLSVKDAIKYLSPKTNTYVTPETRGRFSPLLLEHGERPLHDWAVVAYSSLVTTSVSSNNKHHNSRTSNTSQSGIQWEQSPLKQSRSQNHGRQHSRTGGTAYSATSSNKQNLSKDSLPSAHLTKVEGRLHLCTASLVFEPTDPVQGLVRCPFAKMDSVPVQVSSADSLHTHLNKGPDTATMTSAVECTVRRHATMKHHNTIGPYQHVTVPCRFVFWFQHSQPQHLLALAQQLFDAHHQGNGRSSNPNGDANPVDTLLQPMLDRPFWVDNLVDVREQALTSNVRCSILKPLQKRPGVVVVTRDRLYFQPATGLVLPPTETEPTATKSPPTKTLNNSFGGSNRNLTKSTTDYQHYTTERAEHWLQSDVVATARRYNGLRDAGLEVYWKDETSTLFLFERRHDREQVWRCLLRHQKNPESVPCFTDRSFLIEVVREWSSGHISNYDYLLALNAAAGRSFHDLSRYPVFPWVIADYTSSKLDLNESSTFRNLSKPIGALSPERLQYFKERLAGMEDMDEAFLYGTHYSAPGYVLYFLVRSMPEHMLCLQNGKFDSPDRMFHSLAQCYKCCLSNHADVKELIPEFFNSGSNDSADFLLNTKGLSLGATQNGDRVNDVTLPPWARSARDFVKKNRKALECELVTAMLPKWIDLMFGHKSRGQGAMEANNVFHHNAYLGPTELAGMQTEQDRFQAELQATEFGIVPDLLFAREHPRQSELLEDDLVCQGLGRASSSKDETGREAWELLDAPTQESHRSTGGTPVDCAELDASLNDRSENNFEQMDGSAPNPNPSRTTDHWDKTTHQTEPTRTPAQTSRHLALRGSGESLGIHQTATNSHDENSFLERHDSHEETVSRHGQLRIPQQSQGSPQVLSEETASEWDMDILERKHIHSDAVSGCRIILLDEEVSQTDSTSPKSILVTTSLDGGLKVHTVTLNAPSIPEQPQSGFVSPFSRFAYSNLMRSPNAPFSSLASTAPSKLNEYRTHSARDPLASLCVASDGAGGSVAFAGGHDDVVLAYGVRSACAVASVYSHRDAVTGLDLLARRSQIDNDCALWLENSTHILTSGSWDATVKVWSVTAAAGETVAIHREPLAELFDADSSIVCVSAAVYDSSSAKSLGSSEAGGIVICAGCTGGSFCVWNVHADDGCQVLIHSEAARRGSGPCSVVRWVHSNSSGGHMHLFCGFSTGKLAAYTLSDGSLRRESAVSVGVAVTALEHAGDGVLLVGCADGGLRLLSLKDGCHFGSKPTLFQAVNNKKTSPGISSISLTYTKSKCVCCTGAEDGSVALFELKHVVQQPTLSL